MNALVHRLLKNILVPITQRECMGARNTCLYFAGRLSWIQYLPRLSLSLQVGTMSQLLVLGLF